MTLLSSRELRALETCALCGVEPSTPTGEHVIPRRFLRAMFPEQDGPYTSTSLPGVEFKQFDAVKLACGEACNQELNKRFEGLKADAASRLLSKEEPALDAEQTRLTALWLLKTWLLLAHPRSEFRLGTPDPVRWTVAPSSIWSWLVNNEEPPAGLSMWVFLHRQNPSKSRTPDGAWLDLPHVIADGLERPFLVIDLTLKLVNVVVVWHPGWPIQHSPAQEGVVRQLWPLADGTTIPRLPELDHRPIRWGNGPQLRFLPGTFDETLPPLTPGVAPDVQVMERVEAVAWGGSTDPRT